MTRSPDTPLPATKRPGMLTLDEAAAYTGRSRFTLRDHVLKGKLEGYRFNGDKRTYVRLTDVEAYCAPIPTRPTEGDPTA